MNHARAIAAVALLFLAPGCSGQTPDPAALAVAGDGYVSGPSTRGGTGRYFMGREIAYVMSHLGAGWLDRDDRERTERTDLLIANLPLESDSVVADIGAGSGYFSLRIAQKVPSGTVYAVDIQPEMLAMIEQRAQAANLANIELIAAEEKATGLPDASVDLALMVDAYHEFAWPREVMTDLRRALRPGGKVVLVEYRAEDPTVPIIPVHKMTEAQAIKELTALGFEFVSNEDFLPQQHFLIFARPR